MMKILFHYPQWGNRWIPYIERELNRYDLTVTSTEDSKELARLSEEADILFSAWLNEIVVFWSKYFPDKKIISYVRSYEIWKLDFYKKIDFQKINALIFVSSFGKKAFNQLAKKLNVKLKCRQYIIPNGIDLKEFPYRTKRAGTNKIAMVCALNLVKNIPLALQILMRLPEEYKIHLIGGLQEVSLIPYIRNFKVKDRFITEDPVPKDKVYEWLMDKDFILSTSTTTVFCILSLTTRPESVFRGIITLPLSPAHARA